MQGASSPLTDWINSDVKTANTVSIIMIIFAAWAGIEAISNVAGIAIPPETGMATNIDPDDTQRTNNGVIVGLGAVLGTLGLVIQSLIPRGEEEQEESRGPVFDEDLVKLTKWLCSRGTTTVQFFEWADTDNSGSIDMVEFANALRAAEIANLPPWEIEELVKLMDINSDGRINLPELDIALLNIRNALGIEFIPYVEEEKPEEEVAEGSEDEAEEVEEPLESTDDSSESDEESQEDEAEAEPSEEAETEKESSEDDEAAEDDSEDATEEAVEDATESTEDSTESDEEPEEAEAETESLEDGESAEDDSEESTEEETEVEESDEASEDDEGETDESDEAVEETEDSEDEPDEQETTEEVVEEAPKKKKKF
ncbi:MAG: EF-hand domain-containing protein [Candidatus Thermoplasmatota archaeon]|nr:EF-hand domain-containing protein [Candidatus Thermoplasmatota archaeon]